MEPTKTLTNRVAKPPPTRANKVEDSGLAGVPEDFRRLNWNELVKRGDFLADETRGFEPWKGPGGFRADAFTKPVYRRNGDRTTGTRR